jgi:hypothetical protein
MSIPNCQSMTKVEVAQEWGAGGKFSKTSDPLPLIRAIELLYTIFSQIYLDGQYL